MPEDKDTTQDQDAVATEPTSEETAADQNPGAEAAETTDTPIVEEPTTEEHSHLGPILGVLIIVLVVILGGLYLWGSTLVTDQVLEVPRVIENNEPETPGAQADVNQLETVSTSDEIEAIEADLESTNLDELDAELNAIDSELEAELN